MIDSTLELRFFNPFAKKRYAQEMLRDRRLVRSNSISLISDRAALLAYVYVSLASQLKNRAPGLLCQR